MAMRRAALTLQHARTKQSQHKRPRYDLLKKGLL
jgi:hypothetical protein